MSLWRVFSSRASDVLERVCDDGQFAALVWSGDDPDEAEWDRILPFLSAAGDLRVMDGAQDRRSLAMPPVDVPAYIARHLPLYGFRVGNDGSDLALFIPKDDFWVTVAPIDLLAELAPSRMVHAKSGMRAAEGDSPHAAHAYYDALAKWMPDVASGVNAPNA